MSALANLAIEIGAKNLHKTLSDNVGPRGADIADAAVRAVAARVGVEPNELPQAIESDRPRVVDAVREVERLTPELAAVYQRGIDLQLAELQARETAPVWTWAWRPAWMWALLGLWLWAFIGEPVINATTNAVILRPVNETMLMQLTGIFLALYMGGHTVLRAVGKAGDK